MRLALRYQGHRCNDDSARPTASLANTCGTEVNGVRCDKNRLAPGDVLALAGYFDFEVVEQP